MKIMKYKNICIFRTPEKQFPGLAIESYANANMQKKKPALHVKLLLFWYRRQDCMCK